MMNETGLCLDRPRFVAGVGYQGLRAKMTLPEAAYIEFSVWLGAE
jgi:hypothetical protein